jgi:flavin reductase (DIM6/NTAB) family NADH-FMN oxidoreductase RutF
MKALGSGADVNVRIPKMSTCFWELMSTFPSGVAVVTTIDDEGRPFGLTCSSLCSASLEPPLLLVCMDNRSRTLETILVRRIFAVNFLHSGGREAADLFSTGAPNLFERIPWELTAVGALPSLFLHAHRVAGCTVRESRVAGDHTVIVGEVTEVTLLTATAPLLYGLRQYTAWPGSAPDQRPAGPSLPSGVEGRLR